MCKNVHLTKFYDNRMFEAESSAKGSLPSKPSQAGFYALIRDAILTESGNILFSLEN